MAKVIPRREDVTEDMPLRLDIAAALAFPDGSIGVSGLRTEAARGRLQTWRIAGKQMTTLAEIRRMIDRCRDNECPPISGSGPLKPTAKPSGASSMAESDTALTALKMRVRRLKESSRNTSPPSTSPPSTAPVIPLKPR